MAQGGSPPNGAAPREHRRGEHCSPAGDRRSPLRVCAFTRQTAWYSANIVGANSVHPQETAGLPYGFVRSRICVADGGTCRLPSLRERVDMPLRGNRGRRPLQVCANNAATHIEYTNVVGTGVLDCPRLVKKFLQTMRLRWPSPAKQKRTHDVRTSFLLCEGFRKGCGVNLCKGFPHTRPPHPHFTRCLLILREVVFSNSSSRSSSAMIFLKEATRLFCSTILS